MKKIKVKLEVTYVLPEVIEFNTIEDLIDDWFKDINFSHATRDSHELTKQFIGYELCDGNGNG